MDGVDYSLHSTGDEMRKEEERREAMFNSMRFTDTICFVAKKVLTGLFILSLLYVALTVVTWSVSAIAEESVESDGVHTVEVVKIISVNHTGSRHLAREIPADVVISLPKGGKVEYVDPRFSSQQEGSSVVDGKTEVLSTGYPSQEGEEHESDGESCVLRAGGTISKIVGSASFKRTEDGIIHSFHYNPPEEYGGNGFGKIYCGEVEVVLMLPDMIPLFNTYPTNSVDSNKLVESN